MTKLPESLEPLRDAWLAVVAPPRRRATIAAACFLATVAMLVARMGTGAARLGAVAILAFGALGIGVARALDARVFRDPARTIRRVAGAADPALAARAVRALSLLDAASGSAARGASVELAELHVRRALAALPREGVKSGASRVALVLGVGTLLVAAATVASCVANPWAVVEGADVLVARGGVAPLGMAWLSGTSMRARPPDYLHQEERPLSPYDDVALARGTLLTVRGTPVHSGRRLLLTDGVAEVPFVEDGAGHVVARWPLAESVRLRVVARFGDVVIPDSRETPVESIPDMPPVIALEGAPRQIRLAAEPGGAEELSLIHI